MTDQGEFTPEQVTGLNIAREMAAAGIPIFSAHPCPPECRTPGHGPKTEFHLPLKWQKITPADAEWQIGRWRPGMGLAAIGGGAADFLDEDPRHGGDVSVKELQEAGVWPRTFGVQRTKSGGRHFVISPLGEHRVELVKAGLPGLDYQGGAPDGEGRAFIWLAPTAALAKGGEHAGEVQEYRWEEAPDLELLADFAGSDDSGEVIKGKVIAAHAASGPATPASPQVSALQGVAAHAPLDPLFATDAELKRERYAGAPREFTQASAEAMVRPALSALRAAPLGSIEARCNDAALMLSHFVPAFWDADTAYAILIDNLSHTAYDPNHPASGWTADKFKPVLDGRRPGRDPWQAVKLAAVPEALSSEGVAPGTVTGRLRRALLKRSEIHLLPDPVPLIEHVLYAESLMVLSGKFGTYKSFVAVSMACSLAAGRPWFGRAVPHAVPVIYAAAEGAYGIKKRIDAWEAKYGPVPDELMLLPLAVRLNSLSDMAELSEIVQESGAKVLIFDTLHASTPGVDENNSGEMGLVVDTLRTLRDKHGVASILPHHTGHAGQRARGSSSIEDDADISFVIELDGEDRGPKGKRTMRHRKTKDDALIEPVVLKLELVEGTGSGYVTGADEFESASGQEEAPDHGQERVLREPEPWTYELTLPDAVLQRRILEIIWRIGRDVGITEEKARTVAVERWYEGMGRNRGQLNKQAWLKAWRAVVGRDAAPAEGMETEPLVLKIKGTQSFVLNGAFHPGELDS